MPSRLICVATLVAWSYATFALFKRDILPGLLIGPPPDLRAVAKANDETKPSRWSILIPEDSKDLDLRSVGLIETDSRVSRDGWLRLQSKALFDARELMRGTPLDTGQRERVTVTGIFDIDNVGNLESFRATVGFESLTDDVVILTGFVRGNELEVSCQSAYPLLNWSRSLPYEPRELVQSPMAPLERLPGLQVGQTWSSRVVNPLTGRVDRAQVNVERRRVITWDSNPVTTFEVVSRLGLITARTWVRAEDGLVLRQEAPLPFVRILLERTPERYYDSAIRMEDTP